MLWETFAGDSLEIPCQSLRPPGPVATRPPSLGQFCSAPGVRRRPWQSQAHQPNLRAGMPRPSPGLQFCLSCTGLSVEMWQGMARQSCKKLRAASSSSTCADCNCCFPSSSSAALPCHATAICQPYCTGASLQLHGLGFLALAGLAPPIRGLRFKGKGHQWHAPFPLSPAFLMAACAQAAREHGSVSKCL